jgi:signal transduction histidine kinase/ligand-binding sensor domain-containing protein
VSAIAGAPDGSLYVGLAIAGRGLGLERVKNAVVRPLMVPGFDGSSLRVAALFVDQTGTLWVGTQEQGIYRVHGNEVEHYDSKVGLSGDSVRSIFEDHEGDVWVTTANGVDCFRDLKVLSWSKQEGLSTDDVNSAVAGRDGSVWVGTENGLDVLRNGRVSSVGAKGDLPGSRVTSILEDHLGRLWVGVDDKLAIYTEGKFKLLHRPGGRPIGTTFALAEDADGDIWASAIGGHGSDLLRIRNAEVLEVIPSTVIPPSFPLAADAHSGVWLGLSSGDIGLYRNGHFQLVPTGIKGSPILNLAVDTDGSVLGSTRVGVVGWKDGKARMLNSANGLPCDSVTSLIVSDRHSLLLRASCGMIHIDEEQLRKWWMNPKVQVTYRLFDNFDGARASGTSFQPRVSKAPDGKIWFANESELQMFDPAHVPENQIVPPVHIEEVIADRKTYASAGDISLPPLTRELEIRYAGLSFKVPQKVRFRYRLEGRETNWQEPGGRREAFYQDLRPGHYRFRVIACNDDGIWNETGATQDFSIAPTWYQTRWFLILSIACTLLLLWTIYLLRVRYIAKAIAERFDERLAERTRIARDLHDTLLQTIQGSKLVADSALKSSSDFSRMRGSMEQLSAWLGRATEEGRAALNSLRTSATERNDLAAAFRRAMDECHMQSSMEASFSVVGEPSEMHPIVRDEVYRIGYEAIRNACVHSQAARIQVELTYADDLVLCVSDDGRGIDPAIAVQGKEGHFGLQGMRERAVRIMARLTVEGPPGTKITLIVPGGIIYRGTMSGRRTLRAKIESLLTRIGLRSNPPAH